MKLPTKNDIWKYLLLAAVCLINIAEMSITEKYFDIIYHGWVVLTPTSIGQLYMMCLFPLLYGIFSRLLTRATVIPTVFFIPFSALYSLFAGVGSKTVIFVLIQFAIALAGSLITAAFEWIFSRIKGLTENKN